MSDRKHGDFLQDILDSINNIEIFIEGYSLADFMNDRKTVSAVLWNLQVIGEAAKHIPEDVGSLYAEIPWKDMTQMRDKVSHGYFGLNFEVVWDTATRDLPRVKPLIQKALLEIDRQEKA